MSDEIEVWEMLPEEYREWVRKGGTVKVVGVAEVRELGVGGEVIRVWSREPEVVDPEEERLGLEVDELYDEDLSPLSATNEMED